MAENVKANDAWLGEIPRSWGLKKINALYILRNQKVSDIDYPPLSVTKQGVLPQLETAAKTNDHNNRKLVKKGDFAINSRSDRRGSCGISEYNGSVSLINTVIKPLNVVDNRYYSWLFHTDQFADEFYKWGHGIVDDLWTTTWDDMKSINLPVPPFTEQSRIADFLDSKCAEIDSLSADIQKQIDTLEEYKKSVITEAVTKGLDPDVEMKESGVEWIGAMPSTWKIKKIKHCAELERGRFSHRPRNDPRYYDGAYPFIQTGDVATTNKYIRNYSQTLNVLGRASSKCFKKNNIAFTLAANVADVAILGFDVYFPDSIMAIKPVSNYNVEYLYYILSIMKEQFLQVAIINTQLNLNVERVGGVSIPVCDDMDVQLAIVEYLNAKCAEIDTAIDLKKKQLTTLGDYKKSLIYEYVTGKKEVPNE